MLSTSQTQHYVILICRRQYNNSCYCYPIFTWEESETQKKISNYNFPKVTWLIRDGAGFQNYEGLPDSMHSLTIESFCLSIPFAQAAGRDPRRPQRDSQGCFFWALKKGYGFPPGT